MTDPQLHDVLQAIDGSPQWEVVVSFLVNHKPVAFVYRRPEAHRVDAIRAVLHLLLPDNGGPVTITTSKIKE